MTTTSTTPNTAWRGWPTSALVALVKGYRLLLSPWIGNACRFEPSCSRYAIEALQTHGAATGSYLAACRIARCNPLCRAGHDPVPQHPWMGVKRQSDRALQLFTRLLNRADS